MITAPESVRRRRGRPGAAPALGSVVLHAVGVALALATAASRPDLPDFVSYQIELVSMPTTRASDLVIEVPPTAPPDPAPAVPEPVPPREVAPEPVSESPPAPQPPAAPSPPTRAAPSAESTDAMNVRIEGLRRDYPAYYNNIILQIQRCFRWQGQGTPETEVYFVINEDGSVSDMRFVRQSGNPSFDYEALGAVECAGQPGFFGPLPDDLPFDRLPIRFTFRPGGGAGIFR